MLDSMPWPLKLTPFFSDRSRAQSVTNLEFLLLAMRAIGAKHSITNHFIAQLELDMNAAGISDAVPECPTTLNHYPTKLPEPNKIFDELNSVITNSKPSMTEVLEDLTAPNIAAGFKKNAKPLHPFSSEPNIVPYFIR